MTRTILGVGLLVAALLVAACGGPSTPAYLHVQPCLRQRGLVLDRGRPPALPVASPYNPELGRMPAPASFRRDLELSYTVAGKGANDLRLLYFEDEDAAQRSYDRIRRHSPRRGPLVSPRNKIAYVPGAVLELSGPVLLLWSSSPTSTQRGALTRCLG